MASSGEFNIPDVEWLSDNELAVRVDNLVGGLKQYSNEPQADPYQKALLQCVVGHCENSDPTMLETLRLYTKYCPDDSLAVTSRKMYSAFQERVIPLPQSLGEPLKATNPTHKRDPKYPEGYDRPEKWDALLQRVNANADELTIVRLNLNKVLQANIPTRFGPLVVTPQLFGFKRLNLYSGGCSFGLIEKLMHLHDRRAYQLPLYSVGSLAVDGTYVADTPSTDTFQGLVNNRGFSVGKILGSDLDPPSDPYVSSYAYSNCFRAPEFQNPRYRRLVQMMLTRPPNNLTIMRGDFTAENHVAMVRARFPEWFALPSRWVQLVTTEYQTTRRQQKQTDDNARRLAGEDGYILRMDFAEKDSTRPNGLRYREDNWPPWSYKLFVTPVASEERTPIHVFTMRDGRTTEIIPGEDLTKLAFGSLLAA